MSNKKQQQLIVIAKTALKDFDESLDKIGQGSSDLARGIKYKITGTLISYTYDEYGDFLDKGTKPHRPPIKGLKKWADEKGLNVWAVAKGIEKRGTRAQPWLNNVTKELMDLDTEMYKYLNIMVEEDFEQPLKNKGFKIK